METFIMYAFFIAGLVLIVKGGDWFVDGASWVAEVTGIPKFVVGATIVSMATTLPEIIVSTVAAIEGHGILMSGVGDFMFESQEKVALAIGNAIGSVICNTAMIMALSLIFMNKEIDRRKFTPKVMLLGVVLVALIILTRFGALSTQGALVLFVFFIVFIVESVRSAKSNSLDDDEPVQTDKKTAVRNIVSTLIGAGCLGVGSQLIVDYSGAIARSWGVSESILGITLVAIGTSLPELVTAIVAIVKKQPSMSVGNVIGASIIDVAFILPLCSLIYGNSMPVSVQNVYLDFPVCIIVSLVAFVPAVIVKKFYRWQGILLMLIYIIYLVIVAFGQEWYFALFNM